MLSQPIQIPLEVALFFVQQLPPQHQQAILEWLLAVQPQKNEAQTGTGIVVGATLSEREKHLQIIAKGGDASYIEDPVEWQRDIRKDRDLPFKEYRRL